ncbi:MAG: hypothetical protein P9M11_09080 [Candidatus Tenebribacter burtonii]|nr:hypothetical protein [Candidatus Tenebribacter burtonii]
MPYVYERKFERDRRDDGRIRKTRGDALLSNVAPDLWKKIGCRRDKTVNSVLKDYDVTSITQLRKKFRE